MMENLLSSSSSVIDTTPLTGNGSGRESPVSLPEFDGETVLCRVCGDKASGFHYGVHACEGCKGFFRRSIQQKIQYRPCLKNQQCNIQRVNRNRCQYCRLKKCISVGMSRDAVRFGRVPKKEKARIIEQMQKKNSASQSNELSSLLANDLDVVQAVVNIHRHTCDISQLRAHQMRELALHNSEYVNCPANMACPLNNEMGMDSNANRQDLTDFSESFTPAIKSVVDFAKGIPGFVLLNSDDQVTLLKAGTFEVLLVRLACLFDPTSNTMMFTSGKLFKRQSSTVTTNAGFLLDSMFDFAERFNKMCLIDDEIALFSAVVLMSPDRPGLRNMEQVERIQNKLTEALQNIINANHKEDGTLFAKLLMKTTDLRTLNTLHSEKSIAGQRSNVERRERQNNDDSDMEFQDSVSTRSGRSSPTLSETSNMTMTSGYSGETDNSNVVMGSRLPLEASNHQQVVLRTPYGTFFREEMSGFYGMMSEQPRRRCNTLDRDKLTRPRLHTIEEGNRRRYTMDKDYINKMVNRLSDRLETRGGARGESIPPSVSSSAASSPIQEEGSSNIYPPHSASFTPITTADGVAGALGINGTTRTSPLVSAEGILMGGVRAGSSPGSPKSRSRSGSFTQEDYASMRPRCYSFHLNSEGRAARISLQRRMLAERDQHQEREEISPESGQYLSPELRRGSVGAAYGLHTRKQSLLVDRPLSYINRRGEPVRASDLDKRGMGQGLPVMKHFMPDGSIFGLQFTPEMAAQTGQTTPHPALWHQQAPSAAMALGMTPPPPLPIPVMAPRAREDRGRTLDNRTSREWDVAKTLSREMPQELLQRDLNSCTEAQAGCGMTVPPHLKMGGAGASDKASATVGSKSVCNMPAPGHIQTGDVHVGALCKDIKDGGSSTGSSNIASLMKVPSPPKVAAKVDSERNSPVSEEVLSETFGHKKFDKFRKDKSQIDTSASQTEEKSGAGTVKEETLEAGEEAMAGVEDEMEEGELKVDLMDVKMERKSPTNEAVSPATSNSSSPLLNDRPRLSAKEAHPNLLAHLMNGGSSKKGQSSQQPTTGTANTAPGASAAFPWSMHTPTPNKYQSQQVSRQPQQMYKASAFTEQGTAKSLASPSVPSTTSHYLTMTSSPSSPSSSQPNVSLESKPSNSKEEFHAVAVSHLKDKLLRKFDSMENLQKIGKDSSSQSSGSQSSGDSTPHPPAVQAQLWSSQPLTSSASASASVSDTCVSGQQAGNTTELNKELATKLTLSSSIVPSSLPHNSFPASHPASTPSSSSSSTVPSCMTMSSPPAASALPHAASSTTSMFHPRSAMAQLPHMLLPQGLPSLPMYHSMLTHQYQTMQGANPRPMAGGMPNSLANMQHFAQMFVRGQSTSGLAGNADKRFNLGAPLNLTSRMEEGRSMSNPSSPSRSPQTPA